MLKVKIEERYLKSFEWLLQCYQYLFYYDSGAQIQIVEKDEIDGYVLLKLYGYKDEGSSAKDEKDSYFGKFLHSCGLLVEIGSSSVCKNLNVRRKKIEIDEENSDFSQLFTSSYRNGLVIFAATIYHKCNVEKTGSNNLIIRGTEKYVLRAREELEKVISNKTACTEEPIVITRRLRRLKSYFHLLPESINESQKLLLYKYMVALVKYYNEKSEVVHYFDEFLPDLQIDLYSWMKKHKKTTDCDIQSENISSKKPWDMESEKMYQATKNEPKTIKLKSLNLNNLQNESANTSFSQVRESQPFDQLSHQRTDVSLPGNNSAPPTTDIFIGLREKYKSLPDNLKLKHPMIYPELYRWDDRSEYFGTKTAKQVILDGSNVAFGHGQFQPNGKYIKADEYNFQNKTCRFSLIGIKLLCERLWKHGCYRYPLYQNSNWRNEVIDLAFTIPFDRSKDLNLVLPGEKIIMDQIKE